MGTVNPIPEGFTTVTPYLVVKGAAAAIDFYVKALGAVETSRQMSPDGGKVMNAQLRVGNAMIMLNDEFPEWGCPGPSSDHPSPVTIHLFVEDVQAFFDRAVAAGAQPTMPVSDTFWGDRYGQFTDPFGHKWSVATRVENLTSEEIDERGRAFFAEMAKQHAPA